MSLYQEWKGAFEQYPEGSQELYDCWQDYCKDEAKVYAAVLESKNPVVEGVVGDLIKAYDVKPVWFMGFLDGAEDSVKEPVKNIEELTEEDEIKIEFDFEKLYWNMNAASADWLYGLSEWDDVLPEEKRAEITKDYKRSKTIVKDQKIGRNDPCPCGSGKKYKKCCGA